MLGCDRVPEYDLATVRRVVRQYYRAGTRLTKKYGEIPELGRIRGAALNERLKRAHQKTLADLVHELEV